MNVKQFLKDWTLPVAIAVGTVVYLVFYWVPQLDAAGEVLGEVVDTVFPMMVFCTLFSTFCPSTSTRCALIAGMWACCWRRCCSWR